MNEWVRFALVPPGSTIPPGARRSPPSGGSRTLAKAARQSDIDARIFFTSLDLDVITESKLDHLPLNLAGKPASAMPAVVAGLPSMEGLAAG